MTNVQRYLVSRSELAREALSYDRWAKDKKSVWRPILVAYASGREIHFRGGVCPAVDRAISNCASGVSADVSDLIVQVIGDGRPGGGTTAVLGLSSLLAGNGKGVVIASQAGSYLVSEAKGLGLHTIELDFSTRSKTIQLARELSNVLVPLEPAIVHAHGARAGLPTAIIPRRIVRRLVYTVHGFHFVHKSLCTLHRIRI